MSLLNAFTTWNLLSVLSRKEEGDDSRKLRRSIDAEDNVHAAFVSKGHGAFTHLRRRVYFPKQKCSREIDVIAITDSAIYVVEVKNWAGFVWRNGIRWYQKPPFQNARPLEFEDIWDEAKMKADVLRESLSAMGITLTPQQCQPVLVFSHSKVKLDSTVSSLPNVYTLDDFKKVIPVRHNMREWITHYIPFTAGKKELIYSQKLLVSNAVASFRTWDKVQLHSGETQNGDVVSLDLPSIGCSLDRNAFSTIRLVWRTGVLGFFSSLIWYGSACTVAIRLECLQLRPGCTVKPNAQRWIEFPLLNQNKVKDIKKVDRLIFRAAGTRNNETIRLASIQSVLIGRSGALEYR